MANELKLKGTVEKVVRQNGKKDAQIVITIPISQCMDIPLGAVSMGIQSLQSAMFDKQPMRLGGRGKK